MNVSGRQMLDRMLSQRGPRGLPPLGVLNRIRGLLGEADPTALLLAQVPPRGAKGLRWQVIAATDELIVFADAESEDEYDFHYDALGNRASEIRRLDNESNTQVWLRPLSSVTRVSAVTERADWLGPIDEPVRPVWELTFEDDTRLRFPLTHMGRPEHYAEAANLLRVVRQAVGAGS